jgi:hypothetical protein
VKRTIKSVELLAPDMALAFVTADFSGTADAILDEAYLLINDHGKWKIHTHEALDEKMGTSLE